MIRARDIYGKPDEPYTSKYGPRSELRTAGPRYNRNADCPMSIVDFSFLKPRPGLNLDDLQELTPEWEEDMKYMILHSCGDSDL